MIQFDKISYVYPSGKGIHDVSFIVKEGEIMGYLGPNGAGKTTSIRILLGFLRAKYGQSRVMKLDCFTRASTIQKSLGYIPGEISFFEGLTGDEFLRFMSDMRGIKERSKEKDLIERFELDTKGKIKKFSKGMKQKLGIVTAFAHDPQILILDEPSSGLDPLMQSRFVDLILEEKKKGKTMLMSSHIFEEVEKTCDTVLMIKDGRIKDKATISELRQNRKKKVHIVVEDVDKVGAEFASRGYMVHKQSDRDMLILMYPNQMNDCIRILAGNEVKDISVEGESLEDIFMNYYAKEENL